MGTRTITPIILTETSLGELEFKAEDAVKLAEDYKKLPILQQVIRFMRAVASAGQTEGMIPTNAKWDHHIQEVVECVLSSRGFEVVWKRKYMEFKVKSSLKKSAAGQINSSYLPEPRNPTMQIPHQA
jgi:hypothetical protein